MKKIVALSLMLLMLSLSSYAFAGICVCFGKGNVISNCGNGGVAANPMTVKQGISDSVVKSGYLVKTETTLADYDNGGKAYSLATGWLCFK
jgi:hypothetical protein